jgi:hypothetical protein
MNYVIFLRRTLLFVLYLSISIGNLAFVSAFPSFEFSQNDFENGEVDVSFSASRGLKVSLYINENPIGSKDILGDPKTVDVGNGLGDVIMPVNSQVIFYNSHPTDIYKLSVDGVFATTLNPEQSSSSYFFNEVYNYYLIGEVTNSEGIVSSSTKQILVEDSSMYEIFENVSQSYLVDGENVFKFKISPLDSSSASFDSYDEEHKVDYDKFPNNIYVDDFDNVTKEKYVRISGRVLDSEYPLYYVLNMDGVLGNTGAFVPVELSGGKFNFTVTSLNDGLNSIRLISTGVNNKDIFTGEEFVYVLVDTEIPVIEIIDVYFNSNTDNSKKVFLENDDIDTNTNSIILNISVDATELNYTFNNKTEFAEIFNGTIQLTLTLKSGKNSLDLIAKDEAGNIAHEAHQINYDNEGPELVEDSLSPDAVFKDGTVHFFLQPIEGKTNKPNVDMVVFTFPENTKDEDGGSVSCDSYKNLFFRQIEDTDEITYDPIEPIPDVQLSLLSLISYKEEVKSDSNGNFKTLVSLQEKNLNAADSADNTIVEVKTENTICMILSDRFGNKKIEEFKVDFDAGNTVWIEVETSISPQNVYESELMQLENGDRSGNGNVEVGIISKFQYFGGGNVEEITSIRIREDTSAFPDTEFIDVVNTRVNWAYEKDTNLMTVYIPIAVKKFASNQDKEEREWFEEIELGFGLEITYTVDDIDVPIDSKNPVWFQTSIIVENTQDWLSPKQLEKAQRFLNKTIKVTEKFTKVMKYASIGGVITCTFAKFKHAWKMSDYLLKDEKDPNKVAKIDRDLYKICDRVAGLPAPYPCDSSSAEDLKGPDDYKHGIEYSRGGKVVGQFEPVVSGTCNVEEQRSASSTAVSPALIADGMWVSGDGKKFKDESGAGFTRTVEEEISVRRQCLPTVGDKVNFSSMRGQICYQTGAPDFDDTKCNFFGADTPENANAGNSWEGAGVSGKASSVSIISSIRCGAILDTYSHSKNILKIQQGIYNCLEQSKIGTVKGSYCQRLFGQAVCDIATNVILPELEQSFNKNSEAGGKRSGVFGQMKENEKKLDERYGGSVLGQTGLQSDQIINKACLASITGDWSALTDNILTSIEANEVDPTFGPPFPESRLQGYDPVTGQLSIRYLYTLGILSGGQTVNSKIELICDPSYTNAEACPDDGIIVSSEVNAGSYKSNNWVTRKGSSVQQSKIINEAPARVWYNKLRMTHTYDLNGESKTVIQEFPIAHKTEQIIGQCTFSAGTLGDGAGYKCDQLFGDSSFETAISIDETRTLLVPTMSASSSSSRPYFEGNSVFANVKYQSLNDITFPEPLSVYYMGICNEDNLDTKIRLNPAVSVGGSSIVGFSPLDSTKISTGEVVKLFSTLPVVGKNIGNVATITNLVPGKHYLRITNPNVDIDPTLSINKITLGTREITGLKKEYNSTYRYLVYTFTTDESGVFNLYTSDDFSKGTKVDIIINADAHPDIHKLDGISGDSILDFQPSAITAGSCNVYMRVLPTTIASKLVEGNFKNYSPSTETDAEGNILSNLVVGESFVKKSFIINEKPAKNNVYFSLVSPVNSGTVKATLKGDKTLSIPVSYILQDSWNSDKKNYSLSYKISSSKYVLGEGGQNKKRIKFGHDDLEDIVIIIPGTLQDELGSSSNSSYVGDSLGTTIATEFTLSYELELVTNNRGNPIYTSLDNPIRGSIKFHIK